MSSTTGLSRTRSLRQPTTSRSQLAQKDAAPAKTEGGNTSPSRLPQIKPLTRSGTTTAATSASAAARSRAGSSATNTTTTASGRPLSGIFSSKSTTTAARRQSPTTTENAPPKPLGRTPSVRQAPAQQTSTATSTARRVPSTSATRPTSSGGLPSSTTPKPKPLGHTRAKSTATALTAATTLRPPGPNATSSSSNSPSSATTPLGSRPTTRSHARATSQSMGAAAQAAQAQPAHRPAFNTNQQHYSPLKSHAAKPLTSTYLAPPSPSKLPSNVAISAETSRLQTELLQLSLIHREAGAVTRQWHESAKKKLGKRFRDVAKEHESLCAAEREGVEVRNVAALVRWGNEGKGKLGLEEKIQALDQVLDGVWHFSEPGGRYSRVVEGFEVWADRVADIVAIRKSGNADNLVQGDDVLFISDLNTSWNAECSGLLRKLEAWRRIVGEIGSAPAEDGQGQRSSLSRILAACTSMVHDMLAELELMQEIEREARRAEDEWIERMNEQLKIGDHEAMDKEPPLWKMIV
ncbi:hypothetical protein SCAR479_01815 [Seiridium cardinale]|uniref:Uncharacterized protein n=1 Tax=Seiridium cardinale TaxID=138064 RepID=A0ABR2Y6I5_9PEZI